MKLNLLVYGEEKAGYTNLNLAESKIEQVIDAECTEIVIEDVISYVRYSDLEGFIQTVCAKLRHGGKITIIDHDLYEVNKLMFSEQVGPSDYNSIIFSDNEHPKVSITDLGTVSQILQRLNLKIVYKRLVNSKFILEAYRP